MVNKALEERMIEHGKKIMRGARAQMGMSRETPTVQNMGSHICVHTGIPTYRAYPAIDEKQYRSALAIDRRKLDVVAEGKEKGFLWYFTLLKAWY